MSTLTNNLNINSNLYDKSKKERIVHTNISSSSDETKETRGLKLHFLNQERLQHIKNRHSKDLVAANNVNDNEQVSHNDEPHRSVEGDKNVIFDRVAKDQVADQGHREVAERHHQISNHDALPHGVFGWAVRCGRDGGLNLKHHVMACKCKSHIS